MMWYSLKNNQSSAFGLFTSGEEGNSLYSTLIKIHPHLAEDFVQLADRDL
jgi:hypothetical protein